MFKGNEQFTTLCKRKDWTTVFCITCSLFLCKNWIHLLQNEGLRAHNYPSTLILGQLDSLKKSQIKDNHLKKYILKMSKPSLDFLKSICQLLFWYFLHESSLRFFLLQTIFATQNLDRSTHLPRWIYCPFPQAKNGFLIPIPPPTTICRGPCSNICCPCTMSILQLVVHQRKRHQFRAVSLCIACPRKYFNVHFQKRFSEINFSLFALLRLLKSRQVGD